MAADQPEDEPTPEEIEEYEKGWCFNQTHPPKPGPNLEPMGVDSRVLICEGRCNPLLREYDGLVERYGAEPVIATLKYIMLRVRQLVYTRHERCRGEHWDPKHGWIRSFRCQVCGAVKKF